MSAKSFHMNSESKMIHSQFVPMNHLYSVTLRKRDCAIDAVAHCVANLVRSRRAQAMGFLVRDDCRTQTLVRSCGIWPIRRKLART